MNTFMFEKDSFRIFLLASSSPAEDVLNTGLHIKGIISKLNEVLMQYLVG